MTCRTPDRHALAPLRLQGWLAALFFWLALCMPAAALAQGADLVELEVKRDEAGLLLDFNVRLQLPRAVDEALQRGVPVYFQAQATTYRARWYWRDERVARATRSWRLSYQPLTSSWRVTQGGLHQPYETLQDALLSISRNSRWKIADSTEVEPGSGYYVEFGYKLDTTQLPRPMQIGIGGDWNLQAERTLRLE